MVTEIKYNGYNTKPSDYECADGDLAAAINLIPEDGALHPILPPKVLTNFGDIEKAFIHKNNFTHYIVAKRYADNTTNLLWCAEDMVFSTEPFLTLDATDTLLGFTAIGNIIVVSSAESLHYCLWKEGGYISLGTEIPKVSMQFALSGELLAKTYTAVDFTISSNTATSSQGWNAVATLSTAPNATISYGGSTINVCKYATSVKMEANTEYAFSASQWYSGFKSLAFHVFATPEGSSTYERIYVGKVSRHNHDRNVLKFSTTYTNICFAFGNVFSWNTSGVLNENSIILEKGIKSTLAYSVDNTEGNFTKLMAVMNTYSNNCATAQDRFIYPFFVRYAVRLYDGSYIHTSTPILMIPNSGYVPLMNFFSTGSSRGDIFAYAFIADLQYHIDESMPEDWKDIVSGVDIFVSQPIYPYNQGQEYNAYKEGLFVYKTIDYDAGINDLQNISYGDLKVEVAGVEKRYDHWGIYSLLSQYYNFGNSTSNQWGVIQVAPVDDVHDKIASTSAFYLFKSLDFEDLVATEDPEQTTGATTYPKGFVTVKPISGTLSTLVTRQTLPDELLANRTISKGSGFAYNNRLHLYNTSLTLQPPTQIQKQNAYFTLDIFKLYSGRILGYVYDTYVYIHTDQGDKMVHVATDKVDDLAWNLYDRVGLHWFFYPDNRAYKAVFKAYPRYVSSSGGGSNPLYTVTLDLKRHETLNGAYWLSDDFAQGKLFTPANSEEGEVTDEVDDTITNPSTVYVSEVNNPFSFASELTVSIGCNEIYALSSAVKAMSTGQFGQFPLYAFTDNGVWALETTSNGAYVARQPVARDVCVYADSITQLDGAVAFATNRGIMLLEGSETMCLSEPLSGVSRYDAFNLPNLHHIPSWYTLHITELPFLDYVKECRMIYDYSNQRIFIYNTSMTYAYVYSLKDKAWGMAITDIAQGINSYPEALAIDETGKLIDLYNPDYNGTVDGILVTRPIKLDEPNALKTIRTVLQRGYFRRGHVASILYGSRDLTNWYLVASSKDHHIGNITGTPYKYFRVACGVSLNKDESIYGCSIDNITRLTNKLR